VHQSPGGSSLPSPLCRLLPEHGRNGRATNEDEERLKHLEMANPWAFALLAVLLPAVMEFNYLAEPDRFVDVARALGESVDSLSRMEAAGRALPLIGISRSAPPSNGTRKR
jgi:hypothetical protein